MTGQCNDRSLYVTRSLPSLILHILGILFTEVRSPTGHAWSGEPLAVCGLTASGSCLTIFGDAPEGCTSYRTSRAISAAAWNAGEPSVARTRYRAYGCDEAGRMRSRTVPGIDRYLHAVRPFPVFGPNGTSPGCLSWLCESPATPDLHLMVPERPRTKV
jgi:hypothetical protein